MLNGIDPILIFTFYKAQKDVTDSKIPYANDLGLNRLALPPIPIYLSEQQTGIYIDSEDKNIDIETTVDTLRTGDEPLVNQKGIGSVISISMRASKKSLGLTLLSAMSDLILSKVTSKEYAITYLHGAITIFNGLLHSFSINQTADTDLYEIKLEISRGPASKTGIADIPNTDKGAILNSNGVMTGGSTPAGAPFSTRGSAPVPIGGAGT